MPTLESPPKPKDKPTLTSETKAPKHVGIGASGVSGDFSKLKPTNKVEFHLPQNVLKKWQTDMNKNLGGFK